MNARQLFNWFWTPPQFSDARTTRRAQLMFWILRIFPAISAVVFLVGVIIPDTLFRSTVTALLLLLTPIAFIAMIRRGWVYTSAILMNFFGLVTLTIVVLGSGGIRSPSFIGYAGIVLSSGILLGKRGGFTALGLVVCAGGYAAYLENTGTLSRAPAFSIGETLLVMNATLLVVLFVQMMVSRSYEESSREIEEELRFRKLAETEASRNRAVLSSILDSTQEYVVAIGKDLRVVSMNAPFIRYSRDILGFDPTVGMHVDRLLSGDRRDEYHEIYKRVLDGERIMREDHRIYRDGSTRYFDELFTPVFSPEGTVQGISCFTRDITERRMIELALRQSEERYKRLVENSNILVAEVQADGRYAYVNVAHRSILGYDPGRLIGREILSYVHPDDREQIQQHMQNPGPAVFRFRDASGGYRWLEATAQRMDLSANEHRFVLLASDITNRMNAESAKKALEEQLLQSQKLEAIGTLAGGVAHDFNNILVSLLGNAELAKLKLPVDHPVQRYVTRLLEGAERARGLVQQILAFSRRQESQRQPVQIQRIAREVLKLIRASIPTTVEIRTEWMKDPPHVFADGTQLHQIVVNLCTNAAAAMEATGGRLELRDRRIVVDQSLVRLCPDLKIDHSYVVLSVSDTGHGIDPLVLPRIFEPFFTTKSHGKGTGLGLSVVHGIVRSHDGGITVQSEPRRGTTFEIYLPEYEGDVAEVQKTETHVDEGRGERILLIDDQVEMLETMKDILLDLGYHVRAFNDPKQALDAFNAAPDAFDLILTDLTMPHLTGIDLTRKILAVRERIPVILTTGYQQLEDTEPIRSAGIREIIPKPFRVDTIAKTLRAILSENGK